MELKEKELSRKYKLQAVKERQQFVEKLERDFKQKESAMTSKLDAKIAEVAQLKSI